MYHLIGAVHKAEAKIQYATGKYITVLIYVVIVVNFYSDIEVLLMPQISWHEVCFVPLTTRYL
jgi:hypothetical protein